MQNKIKVRKMCLLNLHSAFSNVGSRVSPVQCLNKQASHDLRPTLSRKILHGFTQKRDHTTLYINSVSISNKNLDTVDSFL